MFRQRSGMTLLEGIFVVILLGILLCLLIPSVNRTRGPRVTGVCQVRLKNLALASMQHEMSRGEFPGYVIDFGTWTAGDNPRDRSNPNSDPATLRTHRKIGTWAVALLPWLDAQPTYEHWTDDSFPIALSGSDEFPASSGRGGIGFHRLAAPNLPNMQCPSDPMDDGTHGRNSYVCNAGMYHRRLAVAGNWTVIGEDGQEVTIDFLEAMSQERGVFNNKVAGLGRDGQPVPIGPTVRLDDFRDGVSQTMLFSESLQAMPWHRAGFIDAVDLVVEDDREIQFHESARYTQGMVWHYEDDDPTTDAPAVQPTHRINGIPRGTALNKLEMNRRNAADLARPSSAHVEGVNTAFADGATRFIADSIDYKVYRALLTPAGQDDVNLQSLHKY